MRQIQISILGSKTFLKDFHVNTRYILCVGFNFRQYFSDNACLLLKFIGVRVWTAKIQYASSYHHQHF
jgi:hypothetical protein